MSFHIKSISKNLQDDFKWELTVHLWELGKAGIRMQVLQAKPGSGSEAAVEAGEAGGGGGRKEHKCHVPFSSMYILLPWPINVKLPDCDQWACKMFEMLTVHFFFSHLGQLQHTPGAVAEIYNSGRGLVWGSWTWAKSLAEKWSESRQSIWLTCMASSARKSRHCLKITWALASLCFFL